jgi:hypothetical protein
MLERAWELWREGEKVTTQRCNWGNVMSPDSSGSMTSFIQPLPHSLYASRGGARNQTKGGPSLKF